MKSAATGSSGAGVAQGRVVGQTQSLRNQTSLMTVLPPAPCPSLGVVRRTDLGQGGVPVAGTPPRRRRRGVPARQRSGYPAGHLAAWSCLPSPAPSRISQGSGAPSSRVTWRGSTAPAVAPIAPGPMSLVAAQTRSSGPTCPQLARVTGMPFSCSMRWRRSGYAASRAHTCCSSSPWGRSRHSPSSAPPGLQQPAAHQLEGVARQQIAKLGLRLALVEARAAPG